MTSLKCVALQKILNLFAFYACLFAKSDLKFQTIITLDQNKISHKIGPLSKPSLPDSYNLITISPAVF